MFRMPPPVPDETELSNIHRVLAGDASAFRSVVLKYGDRVLSFCRSRAASEEEAEDLAQETFLRAFRSLGSYRLGTSFAAWLFAIAANRVRTRWARLSFDKRKKDRLKIEACAARANDPEDEALRNLQAEAIRSAAAGLPADLRSAVELYYFAELSVAECAAVLGVGEEAVKSRLFRARKKLRIALESSNPNGSEGV